MTKKLAHEVLGSVSLVVGEPVVAGAHTTFRLIYTAGHVGVDDRGAVRVAWRSEQDLAHPQLADPGADDHLAVRVQSRETVRPVVEFNPRVHRRPYICAVTVHTDDGGLWPGDKLELIFGDRSGGGRGIRAPTTACRAWDLQVAVDAKGAQEYLDIPGTVGFPVVAGPPSRLVAIAPSHAVLGEPFTLRVRFEDAWGNPTQPPRAELTVRARPPGAPLAEWSGAEGPVVAVPNLVLEKEGVVRLSVEDAANRLTAQSNPIRVTARPLDARLWWGDLHGQSQESVGTNPSTDYFRYARHLACVDFTCHQANDFQISDAFWARLQREVEAVHEDGRFVCFHGYEWSGNTEVGGDRNVMFRDRPRPGDLARSGHWLIDDHAPCHEAEDAPTLDDLYARFRGRDDVMLVPHVGGRRAELRWLEPALEPVVEVHSAHGASEWFLAQALATGKQVGFIGGSDDHLGRPGATRANAGSFPVMGGLAAIWSPRLDRPGIWNGLRRRACYATSGARILLDVETAGVSMGRETSTSGRVPVSVAVHGTAPVIEVAVFRDGDLVHRWCPPASVEADRARILVAWTGNLRIARGRKLVWHGGLSVSGATLTVAEGVGFDHPEEGLTETGPASVRWRSETAGDYDGVVLRLTGLCEASLALETQPLTVAQRLAALSSGPVFHQAPGVLSHVRFQALPADGPEPGATVQWTDGAAPLGAHSYHVRVLQLDGHMAWSSPTWVTVE